MVGLIGRFWLVVPCLKLSFEDRRPSRIEYRIPPAVQHAEKAVKLVLRATNRFDFLSETVGPPDMG
jgi:hypothetical protein